jgi:hypothetical protein
MIQGGEDNKAPIFLSILLQSSEIADTTLAEQSPRTVCIGFGERMDKR